MYTLGHAAINLAVIGGFADRPAGWAILAGAILPDVPIFVLWARERARGLSSEEIWRGPYQSPFWLNLIHGMHSIPLALSGLAIAYFVHHGLLIAFFASLLLHAILDFPVHAEDAHRQFLPFSQYRFISPISYWDVRYHGRVVGIVEALLVLVSTIFLWTRAASYWERGALVFVDVWYVINYYRSFVRQPHVD